MARRGPPDNCVGVVYLIHFSGRTGQGHQHYFGWSGDVYKRFARHKSGRGAVETRKAIAEGLKLTLAQTWRGTPADERRIKQERRRVRRGFAILCPFCEVEDELAAGLVRGMGPPTLKVVRPRAEYAPADDVPSTGAS
jgi:predicted GIY-YIG superfamily endonuclease